MGLWVIKLPDIGEGVAEAEIVEWMVKIGDNVREDDVLAAVMTDKATVEIPSPVAGKINWLGSEIGDIVAVGSPIIKLDVDGEGNINADNDVDLSKAPTSSETRKPETEKPALKTPSDKAMAPPSQAARKAPLNPQINPAPIAQRAEGEPVLASPSIRHRAKSAGIDIRAVSGTGPSGRLSHADLDAYIASGTQTPRSNTGKPPRLKTTQTKVVGLRRKIAEKMSLAKSRIPHITYVEEIDMTELEALRATMNLARKDGQPKLTILPFLIKSLIKAIESYPKLNAIYDDDAGIVHQSEGVHIGIAAQTDNGLMVPVLHHAETQSLFETANCITSLSTAAKDGTLAREDMSGSTITITSLGAMGGIVTTPVINYPEVAIIGVNKMQTLPRWDNGKFIPRKIMNLSSSFDHRIIDGWDAALFIQFLKKTLETPALIFIEGE